jgi:hypothetical protein
MATKRTRSNSKNKSLTSVTAVERLALFGPPLLLEGEDASAYEELLGRVSAAVKPTDVIDEMFVNDVVCLQWEILRLRRLKTSLIRAAGSEALKEFLSEVLDYELYAGNFEEALVDNLLESLPQDQTEDFVRDLAHQCALDESDDADEKVNRLLETAESNMHDILDSAKAEKVEEIVLAYARQDPDAVEQANKILASNGKSMDELLAEKLIYRIDDYERIDRLTTIAESRLKASLCEIYQHRTALSEALRRNMQLEDSKFKVIETTPAKGKNAA